VAHAASRANRHQNRRAANQREGNRGASSRVISLSKAPEHPERIVQDRLLVCNSHVTDEPENPGELIHIQKTLIV
jgi:hypothetical protein